MTTVRLISEERTTPRRVRLLETPIALVEDVRADVGGGWVGAEGFSPECQLALPYQGLFVWEVGRDSVVGDANQVLFVAAGEAFRMRSPLPGGYGELIVTPGEPLLDEITGGSIARVHPLFRRRSRRIDPGLQLARARFLARAREGGETLQAEEQMVWLLRMALADERLSRPPARCTQRLVDRTKTYLASELGRSIQLAEIARAVGASPGYLTQLFRAMEGVPLHAYLTQLRLAQALVELPHAEDLTALALELGFSSHSHFSARFRRAFGVTPSAFRRSCGRRSPPLLV
jgi:AraC family transcriptional regulator